MMTVWCGVVLAAFIGGRVAAGEAPPASLTDKDIRISLELAQQDKDGFPHAFRVTFENRSGHEGVLTLPVPITGRADLRVPLPPVIGLNLTTPDSRGTAFVYAAMGAREFGRGESVRLAPGERCVREYAAADFSQWGHSGPRREASFPELFAPGATEVKFRLAFRMGFVEDRPEEPTGVESEPVVVRCSFDEDVLAGEKAAASQATPLHDAVSKGDAAAVERLLAQGANVNAADEYRATALHVAAGTGDVKIAGMLLAKGASLSAQDSGGNTSLHIAAANGKVAVMKLLIAAGAEVDARTQMGGFTPLHSAALAGDAEAAKLLLASGADPNAKDAMGTGDTPLHCAAMKGHEKVVAALLDKGAQVNGAGRSGLTPLHYAAHEGYMVIVELLLARGADVNLRDRRGDTPLMMAAMCGREKTADILLAHGADPNTRDRDGKTPLALATEFGYPRLVELLKEHGAKE
jgi:ankyrin repeat protein